jgi:pyruvate dehydrogenase E2 component (dihydrolipoamide acetyltransferase)
MAEFRMPTLGADMEAGTLVEWLVKPGDEVKRGQVVAVVETQKGAIEIEIWENGTVDRLDVETGRKVPVGEVLALLRAPGEALAAAPVAPARRIELPPRPEAAAPAPPRAALRRPLRRAPESLPRRVSSPRRWASMSCRCNPLNRGA